MRFKSWVSASRTCCYNWTIAWGVQPLPSFPILLEERGGGGCTHATELLKYVKIYHSHVVSYCYMFTKFLCNLTYGLSRARYIELTGDPRHCLCCHWVAWEHTCGLLWRDLIQIQIQIKQNTNDCITMIAVRTLWGGGGGLRTRLSEVSLLLT